MKRISSIKQPFWPVWCMFALIACSHLTWTLTCAAFAACLGTELLRYTWRDMLADVKRTYWYERMTGR